MTTQEKEALRKEFMEIFIQDKVSDTKILKLLELCSGHWLSKIDKAVTEAVEDHKREKEEVLDVLQLMYEQYCSKSGHQFMSAGEMAEVVLTHNGRIHTDDIGRIVDSLQEDNKS